MVGGGGLETVESIGDWKWAREAMKKCSDMSVNGA
jgi:hypothetical protein